MFTEGRKDGITDLRNYGITEGHAESSIAPLFQSGAIKMQMKFVENIQETLYTQNLAILRHLF